MLPWYHAVLACVIVAIFVFFPLPGLILLIIPIFIWKFAPQLLGLKKQSVREDELRANARHIKVTARFHLISLFVTVESFVNPDDQVALPTILYVERPYQKVLSYFAGREVYWQNLGRKGIFLKDAQTYEAAPSVASWEPVSCELLIDKTSNKVLAVDTPAGQLRVTKTSKTEY